MNYASILSGIATVLGSDYDVYWSGEKKTILVRRGRIAIVLGVTNVSRDVAGVPPSVAEATVEVEVNAYATRRPSASKEPIEDCLGALDGVEEKLLGMVGKQVTSGWFVASVSRLSVDNERWGVCKMTWQITVKGWETLS